MNPDAEYEALLSAIGNKKTAAEQKLAKEEEQREAFLPEFKLLRANTIRPVMERYLGEMQLHGCSNCFIDEREWRAPSEDYGETTASIKFGVKGEYVTFGISDYASRDIYFRHHSQSDSGQLQFGDPKSYAFADITSDLVEREVLSVAKKGMASMLKKS